MGWINRHATGLTLFTLVVATVGLSLAPVPDWARPVEFLSEPDPLQAFVAEVLHRSDPMAEATGSSEAGDVAGDEPPKEEVVPVARAERRQYQPPDLEKYRQVAAEVGAEPVPVEIPCVEKKGETCVRGALDRFFAALEAAEAGGSAEPVRVVHFGDSLIASDHITDVIRVRLQERFGAGGRGFLWLDRLNPFVGRRVRTGRATKNWRRDVITQGALPDRHFGYAGGAFTAEAARENAEFDVGPNTRAQVFFLKQPKGGGFVLRADGKALAEADATAPEPIAQQALVQLPAGTKKLEIEATGAGLRIFGVVLEAAVGGIVYESLGLPGATSEVWTFPDRKEFEAQLAVRAPALIVTMLGGNDALMLSKRRTRAEDIETATRDFLERLRAGAPGADCLVISPMDSARVKVNGTRVSKPEVREVIAIQKKQAAAAGCAFWDMWGSMGGTGALERWFRAGLINADNIHPKGYGGDLLGEMMVLSLFAAYDQRADAGATQAAAPVRPKVPPNETRLDDPRGALNPFFEKLDALAAGKRERVMVTQFGSGPSAAGDFQDELRSRLGKRFGLAGTGLLPVIPTREGSLNLTIKGDYRLERARAGAPPPIEMGLLASRTILEKKTRVSFVPCRECGKKGVFEVFRFGGSGRGRIWTDRNRKFALKKSDPGLELHRYSAGNKPQLSLQVLQGSLILLAVAYDFGQRGVIYDALGLDQVGLGDLLSVDTDLFDGMLLSRTPDLVVVSFGHELDEPSAVPVHEQALVRLLKRAKGTGDTACLVLGPASSMEQKGDQWSERPVVVDLTQRQQAVAREVGCGFFSAQAAMGGPGAIDEWTRLSPPRAEPDRQSFTSAGHRQLGRLFAEALIAQYAARARAAETD